MAQRVISIPTGRFDGHTYLLICGDTKEAAAIDADINLDDILAALAAQGAVLKYILLTHCHYDHISSSDRLRESTGAKTAMHSLDLPALSDPSVNLSAFDGEPITGRQIDIVLEEGSAVKLGNLEIQTLHTPGHTPGSCCFLAGESLFTGDTLFRGSYGNTGFPGGDTYALTASAARLLSLDEKLNVYPGHGDPTTIARERVYNPIRI
jgi:hydroxyacylglutathione hydrolase